MKRMGSKLSYGLFSLSLCLHLGTLGCSSDEEQSESAIEVSDDADAATVDAGTEAGDEATESETLPDELEQLAAPTSDSETDQASAAQTPSTAATTASKRVWYVKGESVAAKDKPSSDGKTVRTLEQGDPVLAETEGDWAKLPDGSYVSMSELSEKAVARSHKSPEWQESASKPN